MKEWIIVTPDRRIKVTGTTLHKAVRKWGKEHPRTNVGTGELVRVIHKGLNSYWSAKKFLELLG